MDEEKIGKIKLVLIEWNPLGDQASKVKDLDNYQVEAEDIFFHIDKKNSVERINKIINIVFSEAFGVYHNLDDTKKYAEKIKKILNE